jgi:FkbM family methyltransferase
MSAGVVTLSAHGRSVTLAFDDPEDHIARKIIEGKRFYETGLLEDARKRIGPGSVIDVGAHIGNHSLWFSAVCGRQVFAFEPNPSSYRQLVENIALNDATVIPAPFALGSSCARGRVAELQQRNSGMTSVVPDQRGDVLIVPLDSFTFEDVALLKIDAEDSEMDVLKGAVGLLRREKPLLYVEARTDSHRYAVERLLKELDTGYRLMDGPFGWTPTWCFA